MPHHDKPDLVGLRSVWFTISAAVIIIGLVLWGVRGLNKGIDFTGGTLLKYEVADPIIAPDGGGGGDLASVYTRIRAIVDEQGIEKYKVQVASEGKLIYIRTSSQSDEEAETQLFAVGEAIEEAFSTTLTKTRDIVGPVIGKELGGNAIKALILGLVLILIFVSWRYEFRFAVAAIIALAHDVLILVGAFAIMQREIDSSFVPVLLTVVGYSINDTIVIFDRIRENMRLYRREPFDTVVNASLWQTMARSVNTVLTTLFTLLMLYFFGGPTIRDFALGLIIGIGCGAYSSIFVASPVVVAWRKFDDRRRDASAALHYRGLPGPVGSRSRKQPEASAIQGAAEEPGASDTGTGAAAERTAPGTAPKKKPRTKRARDRRRRF
jgi:preprotein translocase subunit SecF